MRIRDLEGRWAEECVGVDGRDVGYEEEEEKKRKDFGNGRGVWRRVVLAGIERLRIHSLVLTALLTDHACSSVPESCGSSTAISVVIATVERSNSLTSDLTLFYSFRE